MCHVQSPSDWARPVFELQMLSRATLPTKMYAALLKTSKAIWSTMQSEHPEQGSAVGADEFLPIFIYVVVQAQLQHAAYLAKYMFYFCHKLQLQGETGYLLTMFESALSYINQVADEEEAELRVASVRATASSAVTAPSIGREQTERATSPPSVKADAVGSSELSCRAAHPSVGGRARHLGLSEGSPGSLPVQGLSKPRGEKDDGKGDRLPDGAIVERMLLSSKQEADNKHERANEFLNGLVGLASAAALSVQLLSAEMPQVCLSIYLSIYLSFLLFFNLSIIPLSGYL
jgi:hypothetical protein